MTRDARELVADFAFRLLEQAGENIWHVGLTPPDEVETVAHELVERINAVESGAAVREHVFSARDLEAALHASANRIWVGSGFETFGVNDWAKVDRDRTRLVSHGVVTLVLSRSSFASVQLHAPNLTSWIGGAVFDLVLRLALSADEKNGRLQELRAAMGMGDAEFLRRAEERSLAPDPLHAEWLVLLGRGDLLGDR